MFSRKIRMEHTIKLFIICLIMLDFQYSSSKITITWLLRAKLKLRITAFNKTFSNQDSTHKYYYLVKIVT